MNIVHHCLALAIVAGGALLSRRGLAAPPTEDLNNGEDLTRPPARFDLRYRYEDKGDDTTRQSFILRRDQPISLGGSWQLGTRIDLPLVLTDKTSADNPAGVNRLGLGDLLLQATLIDSLTERFAWGGGARVIFPTATADQFGSGKYRLDPLLGARWKLPEISSGSFAQIGVRYDFDTGGYGGRSHISQVRFSPTLSIALPDHCFVTLFPSQDFAVNSIGRQKWFVPADFSIGRNLSNDTVVSLEASAPIVKQFTLYDFKLEARLAFSF